MRKVNELMGWMENNGMKITLFIFALVLFTPSINIISGFPAVRLEEIFVPVMLVYLFYKRSYLKEVVLKPFNVILILLGISMAISLGNAIIRFGDPLRMGDLMEFVRVFKYLVMYTFIVVLFKDIKKEALNFEKITTFVNYTVGILLAINWAQYFNFLYFNRWFSPLFGPAHHVERIIRNSRVIGTIGNPNFFGGLMMLFLLYYFAYFLFDREGFWNDRRKNIALVAATWMSLLLTVSRTAIIAVTGGLFVAALVYLVLKKGKNLMSLGRMVAAFLIIGLLSNFFITFTMATYEDYLRPAYFAVRYTVEDAVVSAWDHFFDDEERDRDQDKADRDDDRQRSRGSHGVAYRMQDTVNEGLSIFARFNVWEEHFAIAQGSIIIGNGPEKGEYQEAAVDNEYLLILRRYGIIGLTLFIALYLHNIFKFPKEKDEQWYYTFLFSATAALMAFNIMAGSFYHLQLFPAYVIFIAIYDGYRVRKRSVSD
ncbi:O-antigen ligase family protein [Isachenkonia alkalipeptolytica]|nr:O-antigen ligase family protein [Isachenkonia alkalipeptolytica]